MRKDDNIRLRHMLEAAREAWRTLREDMPGLIVTIENVLSQR